MKAVRIIVEEIYTLLEEKNKSYGNSATNPIRIFSKNSPEEQILVRIDDKLSRIAYGNEYPGDDTIRDLTGYLILLLAQRILPPPDSNEENQRRAPYIQRQCEHTHHTHMCDDNHQPPDSQPLYVVKN
jgi:hypothetical protein